MAINQNPNQYELFQEQIKNQPFDASVFDLTAEQSEDYDRLDQQGNLNSEQIRRAMGVKTVAQVAEELPEFLEYTDENGDEVAIHKNIALGLASGKPNENLDYKPRSRRKLSARQKLIADEPPKNHG